jgi:predicted  nucleic acid-binding Zn-ribbon protein
VLAKYPCGVAGSSETETSSGKKDDADLELLKKAEAVLGEIDRTTGLINRHADVLAAIRIRIEGGPRKSLEELMTAAGEIRGKAEELEARLQKEAAKPKGDLGDLMANEPKKKKSLDDLLGG